MARTYLKKAPKNASTDAGDTRAKVQAILDEIENGGDAAAMTFAAEFDRYDGNIVLTRDEIEAAPPGCRTRLKDDIRFAHDNVRRFAEAQLASLATSRSRSVPGFIAGRSPSPCRSAGCYVPGGRYSHVASAIMTRDHRQGRRLRARRGVLAAAARHRHQPGHHLHRRPLRCRLRSWRWAACRASARWPSACSAVPAADILVGPGNQFVAEAKRILFGRVGIDMFAGPTDSLILADATADAEIVAADLVGQAEHGYNSPVWLVTDDRALAEAVLDRVPA